METLWIVGSPSRIVHVQYQRKVCRGVFGAVGGIIVFVWVEGFAIRALPPQIWPLLVVRSGK